jgi:hypothetical protein
MLQVTSPSTADSLTLSVRATKAVREVSEGARGKGSPVLPFSDIAPLPTVTPREFWEITPQGDEE